MKEVLYKDKYLINSEGQVFRPTKKGYIEVSYFKTKKGYITITINGKTKSLHRVVLEAFVGESELHVDHLNSIRDDNRLCNLEYVTLTENNKRAKGKAVKWKNMTFKTQKDLSDYLGLTRNACNESLRNGYKLKGEVVEYA